MNANRAAFACVCLGGLFLSGCAAGRGPGGEVVVGFDVAKLPESATQLAATAAGFLPEPWGSIASGVVLSIGAGAAGLLKGRRDGERAGWDEAAAERREREARALLAAADPKLATAIVGHVSGTHAAVAVNAGGNAVADKQPVPAVV